MEALPMGIDAYVAESLQRSQTVADAIAGALRQAILTGALAGGESLRQAELAAKFSVSRIPVREALLKLEREGLVETRPRRGTVVTALDADALQEILEMRSALESLALRLAIPRMTGKEFDEANTLLEQAEAALHGPALADDRSKEFETRWGDVNWQFHRTLYQAAGKPRLLDTIENLNLLFARHLRGRLEIIAPASAIDDAEEAEKNRAEWACVVQEHRDLLDACRMRDVSRAQEILERHVGVHGVELLRRLTPPTPG
jgi:DNA-binding GntR family transcriptional regulator